LAKSRWAFSRPRKNISSLTLLEKVNNLVQGEGYSIGNVDVVILAEEPNLKKYKPQMRFKVAFALAIEESLVNIKATTQEGLGFIGRREGLAAYAVVLLNK